MPFGNFLFAVLVDAGSRYEVSYMSGIMHMLNRLAFQVNAEGGYA